MTFKRALASTLLAGAIYSSAAFASFEPFVVEDISFEGLQRVTYGAALLSLPVRAGDELDANALTAAVRDLYASGNFDDIKVRRNGNVLVLEVKERPTISNIEFVGNKGIKEEQMKESLRASGIRIGEPLDRTTLSGIEKSLEDFYHSVGKYSASVKAIVTPLARNRVDLRFNFVEGKTARISGINFVGNQVFDDATLRKQMNLVASAPWWDISSSDKYQKQALSGDLEIIRSYYLDRGYLRFNIVDTGVAMSSDRKSIYITVNVDEGEQYHIEDVELTGDILDHYEELKGLINIQSGDIYSGAQVAATEQNIAKLLGRYGYAYPQVTTVPQIDEANKTVKLAFGIDPGKRMYVREINFSGNQLTKDEVLRREMRQMEGSWLSSSNVELSRERLNRLGYFETVDIETNRVAGSEDQVDLDVKVKEQPSGNFTAGIGFGTDSGISFQLGVQQENFLGSGYSVGIQGERNDYSTNVDLSFTDPYFTVDGISLGGRIYYNDFKAENANIVDYNNTTWGARATAGWPINEYNRLSFSLGFEHKTISQVRGYDQLRSFWQIYESEMEADGSVGFNTLDLTANWTRNSLNRGTFPTAGSRQNLGSKITIPWSDLQYFKVFGDTAHYFPIDDDHDWVMMLRGRAGYGNGYGNIDGQEQILPFFENYYGGGMSTIRGFRSNSVGPKALYVQPELGNNQLVASSDSVGGNAQYAISAEFIVPLFFVDEAYSRQFRTSLFVDAGEVWDTEFDYGYYQDMPCFSGCDILGDYSQPGRIRVSAGVSFQWLSPLGPLVFSLAQPIKEYEGDRTETFQFNIGRTF